MVIVPSISAITARGRAQYSMLLNLMLAVLVGESEELPGRTLSSEVTPLVNNHQLSLEPRT